VLPSIDNLRCFVAAAKTLNFRAAARSVALTPAAFGQRIHQLEDQLGVGLFHRTTRTVMLTSAGLALLPYAERALGAADECVRAARGDLGPVPMEIVLGTRPELGMSWVVPQLDRFSRAHPALTLHLYFGAGAGDDLLLRIRTREIDCAVTSTRLNDPKLDAVKLHREEYVFVGARSLLRRLPLTRVEHAAAHTLIDASPDLPLFRYWRDAPGAGDRLRFGRVIRMGTIGAIEHMVAAGRGVAVQPLYFVQAKLTRGVLRRVFPSISLLTDHFRLVFRVDDPRRSVFEALAATMVEGSLT
jgi:LysR family glycine cleavage system transcriptional activator